MNPKRYGYVVALLIALAALVGAATILTIPPLFDPEKDAQVWITVALGLTFLALAGSATYVRRRHLPG